MKRLSSITKKGEIESPSLVLANWWNLSTNLCHECHVSKVGTYQVMEHGDEVHGDGHVLKMIKLQLEKKKEKNKNGLKAKAQWKEPFFVRTQDTIEDVSDLGSIAVL